MPQPTRCSSRAKAGRGGRREHNDASPAAAGCWPCAGIEPRSTRGMSPRFVRDLPSSSPTWPGHGSPSPGPFPTHRWVRDGRCSDATGRLSGRAPVSSRAPAPPPSTTTLVLSVSSRPASGFGQPWLQRSRSPAGHLFTSFADPVRQLPAAPLPVSGRSNTRRLPFRATPRRNPVIVTAKSANTGT